MPQSSTVVQKWLKTHHRATLLHWVTFHHYLEHDSVWVDHRRCHASTKSAPVWINVGGLTAFNKEKRRLSPDLSFKLCTSNFSMSFRHPQHKGCPYPAREDNEKPPQKIPQHIMPKTLIHLKAQGGDDVLKIMYSFSSGWIIKYKSLSVPLFTVQTH